MKRKVLALSPLLLFVCMFTSQLPAQTFQVEDVPLGAPSVQYNDPEFEPFGHRMVFMDSVNTAWVAALNPNTGLFQSATGFDLLMDSLLTDLQLSTNGPEWGASAQGVAPFYTKTDSKGIMQLWRARLGSGTTQPPELAQLTTGDSSSFAVYPYFEPQRPAVKFYFGMDSASSRIDAWGDESLAPVVYPFRVKPPASGQAYWLSGTEDFVIATTGASPNGNILQISRYNTATQTLKILTNDTGTKTAVCAFYAPEFNGELLYAATVSQRYINIYRDLNEPFLTLIAQLEIPQGETNRFVSSMQPLIGNQGFGGVSYFSAVANQTNDPYNPGDGAIWMLGLGLDAANRFARRVDDGQITGEIAQRYEPETYIGATEVFAYYNKGLTAGANELRRARTGITTATASVSGAAKPGATFQLSQNYPNPFNPNTIVRYQLLVASQVQLKVFDVLGREVATLVDAKQAAGNYAVNFNAKNLTSGIYFYRLTAGGSDARSGSSDAWSGNFIETKKMVLIK